MIWCKRGCWKYAEMGQREQGKEMQSEAAGVWGAQNGPLPVRNGWSLIHCLLTWSRAPEGSAPRFLSCGSGIGTLPTTRAARTAWACRCPGAGDCLWRPPQPQLCKPRRPLWPGDVGTPWLPGNSKETGLILVTRSGSENDLSFYSRSYGIIVQGLISSSVKIEHLDCIKPSKFSLTLLKSIN